MAIKVYNTLTRIVEELIPLAPPRLNMFVCGPTVYDYAHLGHAKTYTQFDFIARYLRHRGFDVFYLQNITDVDDKIIGRAAERGVEPLALAEQFEQFYREDMDALHNRAVTKYARAHDYIPNIVDQIKRLIEKGYAYKISDGYYFETARFPRYGKLSGRSEVQPNDAVSRVDQNPEKRSSRDFCLWKFRKPGEPFWPTEIGEGRPGWHIEDTAITESQFGAQYDLHGGAIDLIFPHHEAEIAQIEAACGRSPMVRYWLHTGFLNIKAEKMSKSLGNFITIRDALKTTPYSVLRYWFLSQHYRTSIDLTEDSKFQAEKGLERINNFVRSVDTTFDDIESEKDVIQLRADFYGALDHDFDTPVALARFFDFIRSQNRAGRAGKRVFGIISEINSLFDFMEIGKDERILPDEIDRLISERQRLRQARQFAEADVIRKKLDEYGVILEDTTTGFKWRFRSGSPPSNVPKQE